MVDFQIVLLVENCMIFYSNDIAIITECKRIFCEHCVSFLLLPRGVPGVSDFICNDIAIIIDYKRIFCEHSVSFLLLLHGVPWVSSLYNRTSAYLMPVLEGY